MSIVHDIARARLGLELDAELPGLLQGKLDEFEEKMRADPETYCPAVLCQIVDSWAVLTRTKRPDP